MKKDDLEIKLVLNSVQSFNCVLLRPYGLQHARLPCPSPAPRTCSNSCPSSHWCHQQSHSLVISFSSYLQSVPTSGSFPMCQFFASGSQSIGVSATASVLLDWWEEHPVLISFRMDRLDLLAANAGDLRDMGSIPGWGRSPWRRAWQPTPVQPISVFLPRESHGQRSLAGYSPWGHKELDMTEVTEHIHIYYESYSTFYYLCLIYYILF